MTAESYNTDKMAAEFCMLYSPAKLALQMYQELVFDFMAKKPFRLLVKEMQYIEGKPRMLLKPLLDLGFLSFSLSTKR